MSLADWLRLVGLSILWGGSFIFAKIALRDVQPLTIVLYRVGLAALALHIAVLLVGERVPLSGPVWVAFLAMGLTNNVIPFSLIFWGQRYVDSGLAAILVATTPFFTMIFAQFLTSDERPKATGFAGIALALVGIAVLTGSSLNVQTDNLQVLANVGLLAAAVSYGFASVFGRRFRTLGVSPLGTAAGQLTASTVMMAPLVMMFDTPWARPLPGLLSWGVLSALAILSTACGYLLYFRLLSSSGATNVTLVTILVPVTTVVGGVAFLGESPQPSWGIGMLFIAVGMAVIDGRLVRIILRN
jgi:drug/metabolite transporter (DMT)-like permease